MTSAPAVTSASTARRFVIEGVVQGVGFRPHVWRTARALGVAGWVRNEGASVVVVAEGDPAVLDAFARALVHGAPPRARIDRVTDTGWLRCGATSFEIVASGGDDASRRGRLVAPDTVTCGSCLREVFDPADRRHRYPFVNCTDCGPRFTVIDDLPYDRARTSMAVFELCDRCAREYHDPGDRRFHAEPVACPDCGPQIRLVDSEDRPLEGDPVRRAAALLRSGAIVAIKGLGGYQLACDAHDNVAVAELRRRKRRPHKPFAVMVSDVAAARELVVVDDEDEQLLTSSAGPIVVLPARGEPGAERRSLAPSVAPGHRRIGIMVPTTPLHHLLLAEVGGPLVMTSGNRSDEPIAIDDRDARERLGEIADAFLAHDRRIACRFDDSVAMMRAGAPALLRRARGYAPLPVTLPVAVAPSLALGAEMHHAFCLAAGGDAFVSPHIGDLDTDEAIDALTTSLAHHRRLLRIDPTVVAHDLHPDLATTHLAAELDLPRVAVQHHHAHMVSVMAEHGLRDPALGIVFDGFGLGSDGTAWGGEWLVGGWGSVERVGHLRPVAQPGGDTAVRHPARMALAHALDAGRLAQATAVLGVAAGEPAPCLAGATPAQIAAQIDTGLASTSTSSAGRLFDSVAALAGVCAEATHDGQPAMLLEQLALAADPDVVRRVAYPVATSGGDPTIGPLVLDTRALVAAVLDDLAAETPPPVVAWRFHRWLATATIDVGAELARRHRVADVCLAGGVFANGLLTDAVHAGLGARGLRVHVARAVPSGDGGLALGQILVAHARGTWGDR